MSDPGARARPRRLAPSAVAAAGEDAAATSPATLCIDVGGTGIKAELFGPDGSELSPRVRVPTPYPLAPSTMVELFSQLAAKSGSFDRVSVGFPGVVRLGTVLTAPHFILSGGEGTELDPELERQWEGFKLAEETEKALGRPSRVGNDADVQGMAVISGKGLEMVITLGTALGSTAFQDGRLALHLELAHHPCHKRKTYAEYVGEAALLKIGEHRWNRRVALAVAQIRQLVMFDHLYVGGGNSHRVTADLGPAVTIVDNSAGTLGGIRLWDADPFGGAGPGPVAHPRVRRAASID